MRNIIQEQQKPKPQDQAIEITLTTDKDGHVSVGTAQLPSSSAAATEQVQAAP
jgi:hypothetical protein